MKFVNLYKFNTSYYVPAHTGYKKSYMRHLPEQPFLLLWWDKNVCFSVRLDNYCYLQYFFLDKHRKISEVYFVCVLRVWCTVSFNCDFW